jgi:hypothetical protein
VLLGRLDVAGAPGCGRLAEGALDLAEAAEPVGLLGAQLFERVV